ncbi:ABC transporter substrate-binding protein [Candidatus Leptofilum sp.]|uniref:ABC transporter substrate-binding protein n=1 Tax=Candidatus Leptofilum sp. TaxID=3241576 RepID=UPI003B599954
MKDAKRFYWFILAALLVITLVACGGETDSDTADSGEDTAASSEDADGGGGEEVMDVTIRYALWDANQLPAYEQCAADFMAANPNITIDISQSGWGDYWNDIQTGMVAGTAPDVFTNHLAKYPEFASKNQLIDIQPFVEADGVDLSVYLGDLALLWTRDGARFGLPKDWDTIAIIYNKEMLDAAGVTVDELNNATWNPEDGGTFEEIMAKLTLDANGNNGLSPDFDRDSVAQYGFVTAYDDGGGAYGQTQWSYLAASTGFSFIDDLYATEYHYDDPRFVATMDWYQNMITENGYSAPFEEVASLGGQAIFNSGQAALISDGSWMIGTYNNDANFEFGFAHLPAGPEGRKSMFNGLADSIWAGTEHPEEAWEWVKYLASPECANTVGEFGVVFPAQADAVDLALATYESRGLDVSAFTEQALDENGTFLFPVTDNASEISSIMTETVQSILLGDAEPADILPVANAEVNDLFE